MLVGYGRPQDLCGERAIGGRPQGHLPQAPLAMQPAQRQHVGTVTVVPSGEAAQLVQIAGITLVQGQQDEGGPVGDVPLASGTRAPLEGGEQYRRLVDDPSQAVLQLLQVADAHHVHDDA